MKTCCTVTSAFSRSSQNALGRRVPVETPDFPESSPERESPVPGANLFLSLDLDLQRVAAEQLAGRRGAVVAIDPNNGEILALVSSPAFDPNAFATGMSPSEYNALQNNEDRPLFNRAVRGTYPPGSTIKPMLSLAALEVGATNLTRRIRLHGAGTACRAVRIAISDWRPEGHGAGGPARRNLAVLRRLFLRDQPRYWHRQHARLP